MLNKYLIILLEKYREGEIYEAIHDFYEFNGTTTSLEAQIESVKDNDRTKPIENMFRGKTVPKERVLDFVAKVFQFPIQNLADFEKYLEAQPPAIKDKESTPKQAISQSDRKLHNQVLFAILGVLLLFIGFWFYQTKQELSQANEQLSQIDSMVFKPRYVGAQIEEKDTSIKQASAKTAQLNTKATANSLIFFTNNIYNSEFIYHKQVWSFATDPKGEDMNSEYGEPYRKEIMPLKPAEIKSATLANNEIWIRFNLQNKAENKLFIDNLYLKIIAQYPINEQIITYNAWIPKFTEKHYEVLLNPYALSYPLATFIEIEGNESKHFSLKVKGDKDKKIENQIIKFRIIASANDGKGNRYTIQSDKDYFLGFRKK